VNRNVFMRFGKGGRVGKTFARSLFHAAIIMEHRIVMGPTA
jgi:hypothetical protein